MNKSKKNNNIVESAVIGNLGHILIVFITSLIISLLIPLRPLGIYNILRAIFLVFIFLVTLLFWFYIGLRSTRYEKKNIYRVGIITAIVSVLPAAFFTILSQVLAKTADFSNGIARWNGFYLVGGPTLFWHRPFSYIGELITGKNLGFNGYILLNINLFLVVCMVFLGAIFFGKGKRKA